MIIVNQENEIINFDNITKIFKKDLFDEYIGIVCELTNSEELETILGVYKSEDIADRVLKQIYVAYSNFSLFKNVANEDKDTIITDVLETYNNLLDVYIMPEE